METQAHGTLVEVLGVGILLLGPSGVGKSECALELVTRGHRLVADDVVRIRRDPPARPVGRAPALIRHYMELRGIGIVYVPDLYGPASVADEARIDLVCRIEAWRERADYERVGLERLQHEVGGVSLPALVLPARPAGSMATLVEVAARDHLQRRIGPSAARRIDRRLRDEMERS